MAAPKGMLVFSLILLTAGFMSSLGPNEVSFTPIANAEERLADFYNWNKNYVKYCDQSSFFGDTEIVDRGLNLQFRGSKIFDAVIEDLLAKGMDNADNNISNLLPMSCTMRRDPSLCLFPEYLVGDVQTPLFLLNSAFDYFQTISQAVSNWYFDRDSITLIEIDKFPNATCSYSPYNSSRSKGVRKRSGYLEILFFLGFVLIYFSI